MTKILKHFSFKLLHHSSDYLMVVRMEMKLGIHHPHYIHYRYRWHKHTKVTIGFMLGISAGQVMKLMLFSINKEIVDH